MNKTPNQLVRVKFAEIIPVTDSSLNEWNIQKDREGVYMVFYKNIPAEEIIYAVGEISLALLSNICELQQGYCGEGDGHIFNIALKLIRDAGFAKEFYSDYQKISEKL